VLIHGNVLKLDCRKNSQYKDWKYFLWKRKKVQIFGKNFRDKNSIQEEIKSRLKSGIVCNNSVQNLLSSSVLPKNIKIKTYRTIILPFLYGCVSWSLTLREEHRLRVFENSLLRKIFGHRREEVTGEWRKLHNEELNDLYFSPNIIRVIKSGRMRLEGREARMRRRDV
jgi:hypothetical protein